MWSDNENARKKRPFSRITPNMCPHPTTPYTDPRLKYQERHGKSMKYSKGDIENLHEIILDFFRLKSSTIL